MPDIYTEAETRLATALGWTSIINAGSVLLGTPPSGATNSRGQAALPRWTRDDAAAFQLMVQYRGGVYIAQRHVGADTHGGGLRTVEFKDHPDIATATRYAIVTATLAMLSAHKEVADVSV